MTAAAAEWMSTPRIEHALSGDPAGRAVLERMLRVCVQGLPLMRRAEDARFAFRRRREEGAILTEGVSLRYSAIVLLGAARLPDDLQRQVLGAPAHEYCARLLEFLPQTANLGDVAVVAWAAAELGHPRAPEALRILLGAMREQDQRYTVERAWVLTALVAGRAHVPPERIKAARQQLLGARSQRSGLFAHEIDPLRAPWSRAHVGCFADQVYPTQALSRLHAALGDPEALEAATQCARRICELQGPAGQWWWHYDVRTGAVLEGFPVYSVHQNSMGPMALLDLQDAGGPDLSEHIRRSLRWMERAPEIDRTLIDEQAQVIWRKVARREPRKLVRSLRAVAARIHPSLRLGLLDTLCPTTEVDWESRPYHLGWVLHTWLGRLG